MPFRPLLLLAIGSLAACSSPQEERDKTGMTAPTASAHAQAASSRGKAKVVKEDTDQYFFDYSFPAAVSVIPALAARLEEEAKKAKAELVESAQDGYVDARDNGYPFNPHSWSEEWKVVADLPGYLSLSGEWATYTGGAHGMYGLESLVWDKANRRKLAPEDLFLSTEALDAAMGGALCAALDEERAKRRGEPAIARDEMFGECLGLEQATLLVGSSNGNKFDRITAYFGPYTAGSYAEGAYELDFPMTRAMRAAVRPAYRGAFATTQR